MKKEHRDEIIHEVYRVLKKSNTFQGYGRLFLSLGFDYMLKDLTERERKVLSMRFGLDDGITNTFEEVGTYFGVTRERIRQIQAKSLEKVRKHNRLNK